MLMRGSSGIFLHTSHFHNISTLENQEAAMLQFAMLHLLFGLQVIKLYRDLERNDFDLLLLAISLEALLSGAGQF